LDNITHTLFAATLARTPFGRAGRGTTAALILASNAPDIDIVATAGGAMRYLEWHRGPTHGPLGIVGLGLATAAIVYTALRLRDRTPPGTRLASGVDSAGAAAAGHADSGSRAQSPPATFGMLVAVSIVGVFFHVLMDLPTSYGTRLLSPFDWHWFAFDWMPIIDIYLLIALATGLILGNRSPAARRRNAAIVLVFMAANYGLRAASHDRAIAQAPRVFGPLLPDRCPGVSPHGLIDRWPRGAASLEAADGGRCLVEIAATPGFASPFEWRLIAQSSNAYHVRSINLLQSGLVEPPLEDEAVWRLGRGWPNVWTPAVFKAAQTRPAQVFLGFSRFPAVHLAVDRHGESTVQWTDMRFSGGPNPPRPQNDGRGDLFGATVRLNAHGDIVHARLGGR
jgi:membrane-bound metal-dependent hydrolase YbcI (DUF457 family)